MKKTIIFLLILLVFGLIGARDLFRPGLFTSHDSEAHVLRLIAFHEALTDGQFPPMWAKSFFGGIGSPVLMLNYQLPYYIADMFLRLGFSLFDSFKLTLALAFILSGVVAFFAFKQIFRPQAALIAAFLYMWSPYHFVDIYVRAAFGEAVAFIFLPLVLLAIHKRSFFWGVVGLAGLFLSHPVASAIFSIFFFIYALILYHKENFAQNLAKLLSVFVLAFSLAAFNLLPTVLLTKFTHYSSTNVLPFNHFVSVKQLLFSKWGYGFSMPGDQDLMSFKIGYINLFFVIVGLTIFSLKKTRNKILTGFIFLFFAAGVFLMLPISLPVWKILSLAIYLDYPWRLLIVAVFCTSLIAGWAVDNFRLLSTKLMIVVFLLAIFITNRNHTKINGSWPFDEGYYRQNRGTADVFGEYASVYRTSQDSFFVSSRAEILKGQGKMKTVQNFSNFFSARVAATSNISLRFNIMYFPGWTFFIDKKNLPLDGKVCQITNKQSGKQDDTGLINCQLTPGQHLVEARFMPPWPQRLGNMLSFVSLGIFLCLMFRWSCQPSTKKETLSRLLS